MVSTPLHWTLVQDAACLTRELRWCSVQHGLVAYYLLACSGYGQAPGYQCFCRFRVLRLRAVGCGCRQTPFRVYCPQQCMLNKSWCSLRHV